MNIFIVGQDLRTQMLVKSLCMMRHKVTLISRDKNFCQLIASDMEQPTIFGDASQPDILSSAGAGQCDLLIAMSDKDADNLVICEMAKKRFGIAKTVATVENPANCTVFEQLGIDSVICTASACSHMVEKAAMSFG
jgi:trk system potassium uptake protein